MLGFIKGTVYIISSDMPDSQHYHFKLCLAEDDVYIRIFLAENLVNSRTLAQITTYLFQFSARLSF